MSRFVDEVSEIVEGDVDAVVKARRGGDPTQWVIVVAVITALGVSIGLGVDGAAGIVVAGAGLAAALLVGFATLRPEVALARVGGQVAVVELAPSGRPLRVLSTTASPAVMDGLLRSTYQRVELDGEVYWVDSRRKAEAFVARPVPT